MVQLSRLLEIDGQYPSPRALSACIGDQYLYAKNTVYRKVRDAALEYGFRYENTDSALCHDYQICPLFCLNAILERRSIPFIDNASTLRRLVNEVNREFAATGKFLTQSVKRNYLLHESGHCIARAIIDNAQPGGSAEAWCSGAERSVGMALLAEAFASTVERLAWAAAEHPTHILFFNLNSFIDHRVERHKNLVAAVSRYGLTSIFRLGLCAIFLNNLVSRPLTPEETDALLLHFLPEFQTEETRGELRALVKDVFSISEAFLRDTTPAYFRLLKCEKEFLELSGAPHEVWRLDALMAPDVVGKMTEFIQFDGASGIQAPNS